MMRARASVPARASALHGAAACGVCTNLYTIAPVSFLLTCPNCGVREVTDFGFGGEVTVAAGVAARPARAQRVQLLPPQRRGRAARVVVPPLRLPRVVPRRARHAHERGAVDGAARRRPGAAGGRPRDPPARAAGRADRPRPADHASRFDGKPVPALRGRHDRLGAATPPAGARSRARSSTTARAASCAAAGSAPTRSCRSAAARACARAPSRCATGMAVEHTNAQPGLDFDVMRATDIVGGPFTPPGFYYKTFIRPRRLWPVYEKVLRSRRRPRRAAQAPGRARVAHRVPPPPLRRARDRRRRRRPGGGAARRRAGRRRRAVRRGRRAGRARCCTRAATSARARSPSRRARPGVEILSARARARLLRRARAGLAGRHAAPGPRRAPRRRDRHARAAARLPRQRPARA